MDAWKFVASEIMKSSKLPSPALAALVDNWTNAEFEHFVKDLEDLINEYAYQLRLYVRDILTPA